MGVEAFIQGLGAMGIKATVLLGRPDHIWFDYQVENGLFSSKQVRIGLIVPSDFPLSAPSGPHITPHIHPIKPDGVHPIGAIHREHAAPFEQSLGGEWQYWSRPAANWATSKKSVATYMSHIWRLWDSQ